MKILITDASYPSNAGDAAIVECMVAELRAHLPEAMVVVHSVGDDLDRLASWVDCRVEHGLFPVPVLRSSVRRLRWVFRQLPNLVAVIARREVPFMTPSCRRAFREYATADLVVGCGGGYLTDNYTLQVPFTYLGLRLAQRLQKPTVLFSQSFGPLWKRRTRWMVRRLVRGSVVAAARDTESLVELGRAGISPSEVLLAADVAHLLPLTTGDSVSDRSDGPQRLHVGISVRHWNFPGCIDAQDRYRAYVGAVAALADMLIDRYGARVTFLSTKTGGIDGRDDDRAVASEVTDRMNNVDHWVVVDEDSPRPSIVKARLSQLDLLVATRMHACILAMTSGVPTVNISYEFKSRSYFAALGLEDLVLDIAAVDGQRLEHVVSRAIAARAEIVERLSAVIPHQVAAARVTARAIHEAIDPWATRSCEACVEATHAVAS